MKTLRVSFSSHMLVNMIKKNVLNFLIALLAYLQGALRKKQLTVSSVEHFRGNHENTLCLLCRGCRGDINGNMNITCKMNITR